MLRTALRVAAHLDLVPHTRREFGSGSGGLGTRSRG
jgi:hypothetical protein